MRFFAFLEKLVALGQDACAAIFRDRESYFRVINVESDSRNLVRDYMRSCLGVGSTSACTARGE
jgi:hypothetical protein